LITGKVLLIVLGVGMLVGYAVLPFNPCAKVEEFASFRAEREVFGLAFFL
jgi:hypothetical protein